MLSGKGGGGGENRSERLGDLVIFGEKVVSNAEASKLKNRNEWGKIRDMQWGKTSLRPSEERRKSRWQESNPKNSGRKRKSLSC